MLGWNITSEGHDSEHSTGELAARMADEHELAAHLHHILDMATKLVHSAEGCIAQSSRRSMASGSSDMSDSSDSSGSAACPAPAPELLQGGASAFLASLLRTYPRGPTSRQDLVAWAATATAFLQDHRTRQRQQRQEAAAAAGAAADIAAYLNAQREEARLKAEQARESAGSEDKGDGEAPDGDDVSSSGSGMSGDAADAEADDEYGEEGSARRFLGATGDRSGAATNKPQIPASFQGLQYGGLPLVRRVLLAQALLGWMAMERQEDVQGGGRGGGGAAAAAAAAEVSEPLSRVVTLLYDIHVESVAQRALVEYFHISKAGGTSWTAAAAASGCSRPLSNAARDRDFDDDCRWINGSLLRQHGVNVQRTSTLQVCSRFDVTERQATIRDCEGRLRHALSSGFQYISNEYTLHGGRDDMYNTHICPQFVNVISIREPLARLASNVKYMLVRLRAKLFRKPPASELFPRLFCDAPAERWEEYAPPVADNYNIRTLIGELGFHAPLYGIGEAHEAVAKQLLLQYDLILDLNAGDAAADLLMREGLGWNKTLAEVRVWTLDRLTKKTGRDPEEDCRVGDLSPLLVRQVYDQRWYSFGRSLARLDQLFLAAAAQLGLRPWPGDWQAAVQGAGPSASEKDLSGRCGLLGAAAVLQHQPPPPPQQQQQPS